MVLCFLWVRQSLLSKTGSRCSRTELYCSGLDPARTSAPLRRMEDASNAHSRGPGCGAGPGPRGAAAHLAPASPTRWHVGPAAATCMPMPGRVCAACSAHVQSECVCTCARVHTCTVCMYIYVPHHMHTRSVHEHVCSVHVCMHVCTCASVCLRGPVVCICVQCMCMRAHTHLCVRMCAGVCRCVCACMCRD